MAASSQENQEFTFHRLGMGSDESEAVWRITKTELNHT
jgi:hypothetical protein